MDDSTGKEAKELNVYEFLAVCLEELAGVAWVKLGLQNDPISHSVSMDLAQAKAAIDAISALAPILESQLEHDDRSHIQTLVRNLKLNFVTKSKEASE